MKLLPAYPGMRDSSQCVPHATVVLLARIPSLYLHWSGGLLVWIAIGLLSTPVQAASDVVKNDTVQEVAIAWSEEILNDFRDGTVFAVRLAEHVGKKAASLVPTLQVSSGFDMREFGLKPGKYWYGVRLPKKMSQLDLHNTYGFMSDELIRTQSRWTVPFGAGFNLPIKGRSSLTVNFLLNVGAGPAPTKDHFFPGITIGFRF